MIFPDHIHRLTSKMCQRPAITNKNAIFSIYHFNASIFVGHRNRSQQKWRVRTKWKTPISWWADSRVSILMIIHRNIGNIFRLSFSCVYVQIESESQSKRLVLCDQPVLGCRQSEWKIVIIQEFFTFCGRFLFRFIVCFSCQETIWRSYRSTAEEGADPESAPRELRAAIRKNNKIKADSGWAGSSSWRPKNFCNRSIGRISNRGHLAAIYSGFERMAWRWFRNSFIRVGGRTIDPTNSTRN